MIKALWKLVALVVFYYVLMAKLHLGFGWALAFDLSLSALFLGRPDE